MHEVQNGVHAAVDGMNRGAKQVDEAVDNVSENGRMLRSILEGVTEMVGLWRKSRWV